MSINKNVQNGIFGRRYGSMSATSEEAGNVANQEVSCRCGYIKGKFKEVRFIICNQCDTAPSIFEPGTELYNMAQKQAREVSRFW